MTISKEFLTTGEVATHCAVTSDTVLKWIKSGKIPATRTPGGHYRIHQSVIPSNLFEKETVKTVQKQNRPFKYCWEFKGKNGDILDECRRCIVFRTRAQRCYEMVLLPSEVGHARKFCIGSCDNCNYYNMVKGQRFNVLVFTDRSSLRRTLEKDMAHVNYNLQFTDSEYHSSMLINDFRPDFVVIDCSIGERRSFNFVKHLSEDPRLPVVRIIMASERVEFPKKCDKEIFAHIKPNFTAPELEYLIENLYFKHTEGIK